MTTRRTTFQEGNKLHPGRKKTNANPDKPFSFRLNDSIDDGGKEAAVIQLIETRLGKLKEERKNPTWRDVFVDLLYPLTEGFSEKDLASERPAIDLEAIRDLFDDRLAYWVSRVPRGEAIDMANHEVESVLTAEELAWLATSQEGQFD